MAYVNFFQYIYQKININRQVVAINKMKEDGHWLSERNQTSLKLIGIIAFIYDKFRMVLTILIKTR